MTQPCARNEALEKALSTADLTYKQVARDVRTVAAEAGEQLRTNRSAIAHWIAGRPPAPRTARYVAEALSRRLGRNVTAANLGWDHPETKSDRDDARLRLGIGPDPVDMLRRLGEADINRRKILTGTAYSVAAAALPLGTAQAAEAQQRAAITGRAGRAEIDTVRHMLRAFTAIDERQGGQHGRSAVVQYLRSDVTSLARARFATQAEHADALSVTAAMTYLAGWKAYDASEHGLAQRYYLQALALTREAGNPLHEAFTLRIIAHNGMDIDRPEHTLNLADAALSRARSAGPGLLSLFVIARARALACAGRGAEAVAEVRRAQDLALRGDGEELPYWAALWGTPRAAVASHTAKVFRSLRDHANAEKHYAQSAKSYGRLGDGRARITALSIASQGSEQAEQGHLELACGTWGRALNLFAGVHSDRAAKQVAGIRRRLRTFERRGVVAAAALDEQTRAWQAAHA